MSKARRTHKEMSEDRVRVYNTLRRAEDYVKMGWLMQRTPDINRRVLRSTLLELIASKQIVTRGKGPAITYAAASNNFKQFCVECGTSETPQWRDNGTRCNACAIAKSRSDKKVVVNTNKRHKWLPAETQQLIAEAQDLGEISKDREPAQLARHVQVQIAGLRTYAKTCDDTELLNSMVEDIFKYHPF